VKKVFVGIALHPGAKKYLERFSLVTEDPESWYGCDGAVVYSPPGDWLLEKRRIHIKVIACHSWDEKTASWAEKLGITLIPVPSLWRTVAEHTLALLMSAARNIPQADTSIRSGGWTDNEVLKIRHSGLDFFGKILGIIGLGQIGAELASMVGGFGMEVLYTDLEPKPREERRLGVKYRVLEELLSVSDYVAVLVPLNEKTRALLGERELSLVKRGSVWVNTARGPVIEEAPFLEALKDGRIASAALDVFWQEPLPGDHPLLKMDNVVLSPHLGGSTYDCDMVLVKGVEGILERRKM
jgi:phosphoglycerate dehydrogenase-like enzyme